MHLYVYSRTLFFSITTSPEGKQITRVDIPHPGNKGEIQDSRQNGHGYHGYHDCTISVYLQFYCT